jgi:hypothetical protein
VALDAGAQFILKSRLQLRQRLATSVVCVLVLISVASLRRYYTIPKQAYRAALAYVEEQRAPDDIVVAVHHATNGVRYYAERMQLPVAARYHFIRTESELDSALLTRGRGRAWLFVTLDRALQMDRADLNARMHKDWVKDRTFAGTIGNGDITVWRERGDASAAPPSGDE